MSPEEAATTCSELSPLGSDGLPWPFDNRWRSNDAYRLADSIRAEQAFDRMPILADALEEAGCDDQVILSHCRGGAEHHPECWVVRYAVEGDLITRQDELDRMSGPDWNLPPEDWSASEPRPVPAALKWFIRGMWATSLLLLFLLCCQVAGEFARKLWQNLKP